VKLFAMHLSSSNNPHKAVSSISRSGDQKVQLNFAYALRFTCDEFTALELVVELQMMIGEQILTHHTKFNPLPEPPGQLTIEPRVGSHGLCRQAATK